MATLNPTLTTPEKELDLGGRGPGGRDFDRGWGGGEGRDDSPDFPERLRRYRLGLAVGLAPILMTFIGFTSAYIVRQGLGEWDDAAGIYVSDWRTLSLPSLLWVNTIILLASSVTMEMARRMSRVQASAAAALEIMGWSKAGLRGVPWLGITLVLGTGFLVGQALAWKQLVAQGIYISSNPSSAFFYLLTGTHGLHLAGGMFALLYAVSTALRGRALETRRLVVDVTSWYWHFMGLLWVYILALMLIAK